MGGRAGQKPLPVRRKKKVVKKAPRTPTRKAPAKKSPVARKSAPVTPAETRAKKAFDAAPNFTAEERPGRRDGVTDWSENETLRDIEFGFYFQQRQYLKARIKEMEETVSEIDANLLPAMEMEDLKSVGVGDFRISRTPGTSAQLTKEALLKVGVTVGQIEKAKKITTKKYYYFTVAKAGGGE